MPAISTRNTVRNHPGIAFTLPRIPHVSSHGYGREPRCAASPHRRKDHCSARTGCAAHDTKVAQRCHIVSVAEMILARAGRPSYRTRPDIGCDSFGDRGIVRRSTRPGAAPGGRSLRLAPNLHSFGQPVDRNLPVINNQFNSLQHSYIGQRVAGNHNQIGFVPPLD